MKTKLFNYLITLTLVGLAAWAAASLYYRYLENPWTRDGQVVALKNGLRATLWKFHPASP